MSDARGDALTALGDLARNAAKTLHDGRESLQKEWSEYLEITAYNPLISSAELGGESVLGQVLEHTVAGGFAKGAEHVIEHIAHGGHAAGHGAGHGTGAGQPGGGAVEHGGSKVAEDAATHGVEDAAHAAPAATHAAGAAVEHTGEAVDHAGAKVAAHATAGVAEEAAADVGLLIGGAVIGFAVGVFIETVGGLIYHWLSGEDAEIHKALQESWDAGFDEGKKALDDALNDKTKELESAEKKATFEESNRELAYMHLIGSTTDLKKTQQISAEIRAQAAFAATAKIEKGLTRLLLQKWSREHAADPTHGGTDVRQRDWVEATRGSIENPATSLPDKQYGVGEIYNIPDLFVDQAIHEWAQRGLKPDITLGQKMRREIGITPGETPEREQADLIASRAFSLFNGREFDFAQGSEIYFLKPPTPSNVKSVACYLDLQHQDGTCFVKQFIYYLEMADGRVVRGAAPPGGGLFDAEAKEAEDIRPGSQASANLYGLIAKLQSAGFHVEPQSEDTDFLKSTFGFDMAYPEIQQGTGAEPSIRVFRVLETVVTHTFNNVVEGSDKAQNDDEKVDPGLLDALAPYNVPVADYQVRRNADYLMIRGGDTILWMKTRRPTTRNTP